MVSSAHLRLLIFLLAILNPACASSSPAFLMMCYTYKLNKRGDNIQPWHTPFPILNQSVGPSPVPTVASWPAYKFSRGGSGIQCSSSIFVDYTLFKITVKYKLHSLCYTVYSCAYLCAKSLQLCPTLCNHMNCSPPGSSFHGILQTRILEWVAMPSSRGSSQPRNWTHVSYVFGIDRHVLYHYCHLEILQIILYIV